MEKLTAFLLLGPNLLDQVDGGITSTYSRAQCLQGLCSVSNLPWAHLITCLLGLWHCNKPKRLENRSANWNIAKNKK